MTFPFIHLLKTEVSPWVCPLATVWNTIIAQWTWLRWLNYLVHTYTRMQEIQIHYSWTFRLTFWARLQTWGLTNPNYAGLWVHVQIFKNWVAFWIEHLHLLSWSQKNVTWTEELAFTNWDLIQVYAHNDVYPNLNNCAWDLIIKAADVCAWGWTLNYEITWVCWY